MSTSAGRTPESSRSIAIERSTPSGVRPWPVRSTASISPITRSTSAHLRLRAGEGDLVAADVDVDAGEAALDDAHVLVARAQQAHHVEGRGDDDLRLRVCFCRHGSALHGPCLPFVVAVPVRPGCSMVRRDRVRATARCGVGARRHLARAPRIPAAGQPGGQARPRPPRTCACTWKTVWPPSAPVLSTVRKPRGEALRARDVGHRGEQLAGERRVGRGERADVGVVVLRDHDHVHRRLRRDVAERQHAVGLVHQRRRDLAGHDPAEQAVSTHAAKPTPDRALTNVADVRCAWRRVAARTRVSPSGRSWRGRRLRRRCRRCRCAGRSGRGGRTGLRRTRRWRARRR